MKALLFDGRLQLIDDYPLPIPAAGEALVRVEMAGICDTDIQITKGYLDFRGILGHEFVGIVEQVNNNDQRLIGSRVVGEINCGCRNCPYCSVGLEKHCPARTTLGILGRDGAFAEYLRIPITNLHVVPPGMENERAVFTEPLAACFEILEQIHIHPADAIIVLGDGKLGIMTAAILASAHHSNVRLAGKHENKLNIARQLGIDAVLFHECGQHKSWDVVIDATGSATGFDAALSLVRPRGTIVLKTTVASGTNLNLAPLVIDEITLVGSRCGPFGPALRALARGFINIKPLISAIYSFNDALKAFGKASHGGSLKILLDFRQGGKRNIYDR